MKLRIVANLRKAWDPSDDWDRYCKDHEGPDCDVDTKVKEEDLGYGVRSFEFSSVPTSYEKPWSHSEDSGGGWSTSDISMLLVPMIDIDNPENKEVIYFQIQDESSGDADLFEIAGLHGIELCDTAYPMPSRFLNKSYKEAVEDWKKYVASMMEDQPAEVVSIVNNWMGAR